MYHCQSRYGNEMMPGTLSDKLVARNMQNYDSEQVIWFNLPRQHPCDAEFTAALETLSDGGRIPCSMYGGGYKIVLAHIVVTANRPPPSSKLPAERLVEIKVPDCQRPTCTCLAHIFRADEHIGDILP